jgi:ribonuclease G
MIEEILASVSPGETRIAGRAAGKAVELHRFLHGRSTMSGNIHVGRIARVVPGMGAAFVEIGASRSGFLPFPVEAGAKAVLHEGARVLVQVSREPERGKGAQLSTDIRLPGRLLVFAPRGNGIHVARRIGGDAEAPRLAEALSSFAKPEEGWMARTNAAGASRHDLILEADALRAAWRAVEEASASAAPPALVYSEPSPIVRVLRDRAGPALARVAVDERNAHAAAAEFLRAYLPEKAPSLSFYKGRLPLFEAEGIEEEFESLLHRRVSLPSGGTLVIERTEALWAIDVNTGRNVAASTPKASMLATNIEAAAEAARQIRLRDLAGLIVIDFVHMDDAGARGRVMAALTAALADDPSPARVAGFSDLGLVELSRRRTRPSLADELGSACAECSGEGSIRAPLATALAALRGALAEAPERADVKSVRIAVASAVAEAFATAEGSVARDELAQRIGRPVEIVADATIAPDRFKLL